MEVHLRDSMDARSTSVRVLIIDDEADSILPLDALFRNLGCETAYAIDSRDARQKLMSKKYDIIILDWYLTTRTGGEILYEAFQADESSGDSSYRPLLVTYSALKSSDFELPSVESIKYEGHWRKPVELGKMKQRVSRLVRELQKTKTAH